MEVSLRDHLAADATLAGLVGPRIQWGVREGAPSLALHLIDGPPDWHLKGASGLTIARVQADCWATTFLGAKAIGDALIEALPGIGAVIGGVKFHGAQPIDLDRDTAGEAPNLLHRTRIDIRVATSPA